MSRVLLCNWAFIQVRFSYFFSGLQTVGTATSRMCVAGQSNGATPTQTVAQLCTSISSQLPNQLPSVNSAVAAICGSSTAQVAHPPPPPVAQPIPLHVQHHLTNPLKSIEHQSSGQNHVHQGHQEKQLSFWEQTEMCTRFWRPCMHSSCSKPSAASAAQDRYMQMDAESVTGWVCVPDNKQPSV